MGKEPAGSFPWGELVAVAAAIAAAVGGAVAAHFLRRRSRRTGELDVRDVELSLSTSGRNVSHVVERGVPLEGAERAEVHIDLDFFSGKEVPLALRSPRVVLKDEAGECLLCTRMRAWDQATGRKWRPTAINVPPKKSVSSYCLQPFSWEEMSKL